MSPSYIISRALFVLALLVAILFGVRFLKKHNRKKAIFAELQSITSDSSFFQQFYAADARKSLARAIGLIAEANTLGVDPGTTINRGLGIEPKFFSTDSAHEDPPVRDKIIRNCLRSNYENFLKLGYTADFSTLDSLKQGQFPPIPTGPQAGSRPEVVCLIPPSISPGMDKVIANLEVRPPQPQGSKPTDIEIAAAKQLARDLSDAQIIEEPVSKRIIAALSKPAAPAKPAKPANAAEPAETAH